MTHLNERERATARDLVARARLAQRAQRLEAEFGSHYRGRMARARRDHPTDKQVEGLVLWAEGRPLSAVARELGIAKTAARWRVTSGQRALGLEPGGTMRHRVLARAALEARA